ncbi:MAG: formate C-acetyltransferase/glycerol dehydratase family glycyl radical enzyme [Anaerolineae bacterium]|nr:formate C-acetyltransferase/glycerol dehydratase family glycyl radical enzyme [Anaerolineae bacterium]
MGRGNGRIARLKEAYNKAEPSLSLERALLFTESDRETGGQPLILRRAKAFARICEMLPVVIFDDELIVGTPGMARRPACINPEVSWKWVEEELDRLEVRAQDPYRVTAEQREELQKTIFPYWHGRSLEEAYLSRLPEETFRVTVDTGVVDNDSKWRAYVGEITPDYQDVIFRKGFAGIRNEAMERLAGLEPTSAEKIRRIDFYRSAIVTGDAIIRLGERYAEEAERLAAAEGDPVRREELLQIAKVCRWVPANPPRSFWEASQMVWFVQVGRVIAENAVALNLGRFDQYMCPYYERDVAAGVLTQEEAQDLIECLWIKLSEWVWAISTNTARYFAGYCSFQNLTVGGRKRDGMDGTNPLSTMCLHATANARTHQPGLSVRIHPNCPDEFLMEVCRLIQVGTGFPAVHNDRTGAAMLLTAGLSPEDARDWNNCGCVVPHFRKVGEWTSAANINLGSAIEFALNDGRGQLDGVVRGLRTGDPAWFESFEQFKGAYYAQLAYLIKQAVMATVTAQSVHAEMAPRPFLSTLVDGCMEKGRDLSHGGAQYNVGPVLTGIGVADAANSFAVVEKLVFKDKSVTMEALCEALDRNWEGHEALRAMVLKCPKYGNDDDVVDRFAVEISDFYHREIRKYDDYFGQPFNSAFMGISNYLPAGAVVGATPDGRFAGTPLTEGCSPHTGTDVTSPTAAMKSVAKINHESHAGGTLLNIKLSPDALKSDRDLRNLAALIRAYFELGAFHVQFNVISGDTLRAAQARPEEYRDLLVRVAGYSTRFVTLSQEVQDAIIARTTYERL